MAFVDRIFTAVASEFASVRHFLGEQDHERFDCPPRIVWRTEESGGPYRPAREVGARPRVICTRVHPIQIHLWARSPDELEVLEQGELCALQRAAHGFYELISWAPYDDNEAVLASGIGRVVHINLLAPILEPVGSVTKILDVVHETEMVFPSSVATCGHSR